MGMTIKHLPEDFPAEFTFRDLNEWFAKNQPVEYIGMTLRQEMWYRFLLTAKEQMPRTVVFRGVPVIVEP